MSLVLAYPGGQLKTITIAATAGNVVMNKSPGAKKRWIVLLGAITIITDGTVANRKLRISLTDGSNVLTNFPQSPDIPASTTAIQNYNEARESEGSWGGVDTVCSLGSPILGDSDQLRLTLANGVAGDSYSGYFRVLELGI